MSRREQLKRHLAARRARRQRRRRTAIAALCSVVVVGVGLRGCPPSQVDPATKRIADGISAPALPSEVHAAPVHAMSTPEPNPHTMPSMARSELAPDTPPPPQWLRPFQRQVSARSESLATCMVASTGPGQLQWTTTVAPTTGQVQDHDLVALGGTEPPSDAQRQCMLKHLTQPGYDLGVRLASRPERVRLVLAY